MVGYEIDFLPVGSGEKSGDAITLRYVRDGVSWVHVIDGGNEETGYRLVEHIVTHYGTRTIDNLVLTHGDDDHSSGLRVVLEHLQVGVVWMNRPWMHASDLVPLFRDTRWTAQGLERRLREDFPILNEVERVALKRGVPVFEVFQGSQIGAFTVLAPTRQRYLSSVPLFSRTPDPISALAGWNTLGKSLGGAFEHDRALRCSIGHGI